jgi:hypothetical protein
MLTDGLHSTYADVAKLVYALALEASAGYTASGIVPRRPHNKRFPAVEGRKP